MEKQGMSRPEWTHNKQRNKQAAVPEIQGKAKHGNAETRTIIFGTSGPYMKVYHTEPNEDKSDLYPSYNIDLEDDNLENDLPQADNRSF